MAPENKNKAVSETLIAWLPRLLMLGVIWGIAVFLWGTFGAWTHDQHIESEQQVARQQIPAVLGWLNSSTAQLERLAQDKRFAAAMDLPAGVESLPIQRVLYEFAYLTGQTEVYIIDLMRKRVGRTAGAGALPSDIITRLAGMESAPRMMIGMGQRSGQVLLLRQVAAPLPWRLVVGIPTNFATLSGSAPVIELPNERSWALTLPNGDGWASWSDGQQGFAFDETVDEAMAGQKRSFENDGKLTVMVPLRGWPEMALTVTSAAQFGGAGFLPQLLVGLWALVMSIMVLWSTSQSMRRKLLSNVTPLVRPLAGLGGKIGGPLGQAVHSMRDAIQAYLRSGQKDIPLVAGPGEFDGRDFSSLDEMRQRVSGGQKRPRSRKPLALPGGATEALAKRSAAPQRASPLPHHSEGQATNWAEAEEKKVLPPKKLNVAQVDQDDLKAVVEDCLRQRRVKLLYQPIFRAGDNMPLMHEVYARLVRADGDVLAPDVFLPIIIKHKMALELDLVVLRKVIHDHFIGGASPATPLALNISSTSLDGIAYLQEMANQGPRVLQKISFDVRSQEMIRDPKALRLLKDLQRHGGNLAVDYFGGGTAMLEASKAMGFNYVKLNCQKLLGTDAGKKEVIAICQRAREIGLPVILEMVGDKDELAFGRRAGADFLQGYALARPSEELITQPLALDLDVVANLAAAT